MQEMRKLKQKVEMDSQLTLLPECQLPCPLAIGELAGDTERQSVKRLVCALAELSNR